MLEGNTGFLDVSSLSGASLEQAKVKLRRSFPREPRSSFWICGIVRTEPRQDGRETWPTISCAQGLIYYSQNRQGEKVQVVEASPTSSLPDLPMVVLIDGSTAGAAEITAGALKDHERATLSAKSRLAWGPLRRRSS